MDHRTDHRTWAGSPAARHRRDPRTIDRATAPVNSPPGADLPDTRNLDLPGYYNVDNVVGRPLALNDAEDVLLVQYCLHLFKHHPTSEHKHIWSAVPLTGLIDAPTIAGIEQVQKNVKKRRPGTIVDGRVSPRRGCSYGSSQFTIAVLNEGVQRLFYSDWPRLDRMPACPPRLKDMVMRTLVGFNEGIPKGTG